VTARRGRGSVDAYLARVRDERDQELRRVICGKCGQESAALDGVTARAWWTSHVCLPRTDAVVIPFPQRGTKPETAA
jgi:hypothetical protein